MEASSDVRLPSQKAMQLIEMVKFLGKSGKKVEYEEWLVLLQPEMERDLRYHLIF